MSDPYPSDSSPKGEAGSAAMNFRARIIPEPSCRDRHRFVNVIRTPKAEGVQAEGRSLRNFELRLSTFGLQPAPLQPPVLRASHPCRSSVSDPRYSSHSGNLFLALYHTALLARAVSAGCP
jgi:hypothetical protein